jgi:hypothetical protein
VGHVLKEQKINDEFSGQGYKALSIEFNADGKVHIHKGNIRLDMTKEAYNKFREAMIKADQKLRGL